MKRRVVFYTLTCILFSMIIQSCGSSKGNCDAYGQNDVKQNTDLAVK